MRDTEALQNVMFFKIWRYCVLQRQMSSLHSQRFDRRFVNRLACRSHIPIGLHPVPEPITLLSSLTLPTSPSFLLSAENNNFQMPSISSAHRWRHRSPFSDQYQKLIRYSLNVLPFFQPPKSNAILLTSDQRQISNLKRQTKNIYKVASLAT